MRRNAGRDEAGELDETRGRKVSASEPPPLLCDGTADGRVVSHCQCCERRRCRGHDMEWQNEQQREAEPCEILREQNFHAR